MSGFDSARIVKETSVNHVEYHETLDSTNKLAVEILPELIPLTPALVLTASQTAGRGRGSHHWWATSGALTFSLVLNAADLGLPAERLPLVSLATGLAVREVLASLVPTRKVCVKWPNDILIGEHKVCGILIEQHSSGNSTALIAGVGINVNNSLADAPVDVQQRAVSLFDLTARSHDLSDVLVRLLQQMESRMLQLRDRDREMFAELNSNSILTGRTVSVQAGDRRVTGLCRGIDSDGCLLVENGSGVNRLTAGTVLDWSGNDVG